MPYLTPQSVPTERDCRALFIPASSEWLAIVSGALTELAKSWNWEREGITVDETLAVVNAMIDQYYDGCSSCTLPDGEAILRVGANGHIEQLVDGEWVEPQGDYALPPTPPREEATEEERLCAAAANAANVLMLMYENVSDSFNSSLSTAAAIAALAALIAAQLGSTGFGLAIAALITIGLIIFGVFYALMEFITADMWTEDFNDKLKCVLLACAVEDGDVVHFDYDCVINQLASVTDVTLSLEQVRLFGQIYYLLGWIGAQGLDAAGATTGILDADCEDCGDGCAYTDDLSDPDLGAWSHNNAPPVGNFTTIGDLDAGTAVWQATGGVGASPGSAFLEAATMNPNFPELRGVSFVVELPDDCVVTSASCWIKPLGGYNDRGIFGYDAAGAYVDGTSWSGVFIPTINGWGQMTWNEPPTAGIKYLVFLSVGGTTGDLTGVTLVSVNE